MDTALDEGLRTLQIEVTAGCKLVTINGREYLESEHGTHYDPSTPVPVILALELAYSANHCLDHYDLYGNRTGRKTFRGYYRRKTFRGYYKRRVYLYYGETEGPNAGLDWNEEYETTGYVSRTGGQVKVPLLVHNSKSDSGGDIRTTQLVRIRWSGKHGGVLYQHPNYRCREHRIIRLHKRVQRSGDGKRKLRFAVERLEDGKWVERARFEILKAAERYRRQMTE